MALLSCSCSYPASPTIPVQPRDVPALVDNFATNGQVTVRARDGRALVVTRRREPLLRVRQHVAVPDDYVTFPVDARLGAVRHSGDVLRFGKWRVKLEEVVSAALVFGCVKDPSRYEAWNGEYCPPPADRVDPFKRRRRRRRGEGRLVRDAAAAARVHDHGVGPGRSLRPDVLHVLPRQARLHHLRLGHARHRRLHLHPGPHRRRHQRRRPSPGHAGDRGSGVGAQRRRRVRRGRRRGIP